MISDRLYELAFEYKKTKLWEKLLDTHVFAVKLSDGETGYINIMGFSGEYYALGLYIGEKGFQNFRTLVTADKYMMSQLEFREYLLQQDCLQCAWEGKADLKPDEREEVRKYARLHGIKLAGKHSYPHFLKYQPNHLAWHLQTEQEQQYLCEALSAAIALSKVLKEKKPMQLGISRINERPENILVMELNDDEYRFNKMSPPKPQKIEVPRPQAKNDISIAKMKKAERVGVWECEILRFPEPVQNEPDEVPFFPVILLAVENATDYILPISPVENYEEHPERLLEVFIEALLTQNICPLEIKARDERTYAFAQSFCKRLGIKIKLEKELPALDDAEYDFLERFGMSEEEQLEDLIDMLNELLELKEEQLKNLPPEMEILIKRLIEQGVLTDEMEERLAYVFQERKTKMEKSKSKVTTLTPEKSYVISVSLGTGCYRHIQISGRCTLAEFHQAILCAFGFVDGHHAHAFFMDNVKWSEENCYYTEGIESYYRTTKKYKLNQVGLYKGMMFKYVFDFGDEWTFQCKVLRILEESTKKPMVIRRKGEAPGQYEWDSDDD